MIRDCLLKIKSIDFKLCFWFIKLKSPSSQQFSSRVAMVTGMMSDWGPKIHTSWKMITRKMLELIPVLSRTFSKPHLSKCHNMWKKHVWGCVSFFVNMMLSNKGVISSYSQPSLQKDSRTMGYWVLRNCWPTGQKVNIIIQCEWIDIVTLKMGLP